MRIAITHTTRLDYSADVVEGVMDTRLGPLTDRHQQWGHFELLVSPPGAVRRYEDGFGNTAHLVTVAKPHRYLEVVAQSEVHTLIEDPFPHLSAPPGRLTPSEIADYLAPSHLIQRHPALDEMASAYRPSAPDATFDAVRALMEAVYTGFTYEQHVTSVSTTVPEVLQTRTGVCQDFAHVLIGLCRSIGIPARYISGYIVLRSQSQSQADGSNAQWPSQRSGRAEASGGNSSVSSVSSPAAASAWVEPYTETARDERQRRVTSAGASHAWVEAYTPTHGWQGFDPTNNLVASDHHIKMALGRDYGDVPPTRGAFRGVAEERLGVEVSTRLLD